RLWFTGALEPAYSRVEVLDAAGKRMDLGDGGLDPSNRTLLRVSVPALGPGTYRVVWRVLSVDSHVTEGQFSFRVGHCVSARVPLRAIFFDAGNTLVRIDYAAIAGALAARGVRTTSEDLMRAEWKARVRLDADVFATGEVASTEARGTHNRYLAYVLEGVGVT